MLRSGLNGLIVATGDRVNFRVERGIKGPKAVEVEVVDPWMQCAGCTTVLTEPLTFADQHANMVAMKLLVKNAHHELVQERIQDMADKLPRYYGIIKNFDNTRGLAFIECEETKEVYDKDACSDSNLEIFF